MPTVQIDGKLLSIGDYVCFKSDIEQCGKIVAMKPSAWGTGKELVLENNNGFDGDYIGGQTRTTVMASECWVEG